MRGQVCPRQKRRPNRRRVVGLTRPTHVQSVRVGKHRLVASSRGEREQDELTRLDRDVARGNGSWQVHKKSFAGATYRISSSVAWLIGSASPGAKQAGRSARGGPAAHHR